MTARPRVHPSAILDDRVRLADDVVIDAFAVLTGDVQIGAGTWIGAHATIGGPPEIRGLGADDAGHGVLIGARCVVREHVVIHAGSQHATVVGDDAMIMNACYLAHDTELGSGTTLASGARVAGHARVGAGAQLGMNAAVHQFRVVGPGAFAAMGAVVVRDIAPYAMARGCPARVTGANVVGLRRAGVPDQVADALDADYRAGRAANEPDARLADAWAWYARAVTQR